MVEITLETDEAVSLKWEADRTIEPQPEDPTDTYETADDTTTVYATQPDTAASAIAQSPIQRTNNGQPQAVLVNKVNNNGAVLRILLSGTANYEKTLTFSAADGNQKIDVTQSDIRIKTYENTDTLPDINTEPLLTGSTRDTLFSFEGKAFTVLRVLPEEIAITAGTGTVDLDSENGSKDITYSISIQNPFADENPGSTVSYPFTLTWPSALSRPSGKLTTSEPTNGVYTISCDTTPVVVFPNVPNGASISDVTATSSGLVFQLTPPSGTVSCDLQLTVKGNAFERSSAAFTEQMILSVVNSENELISASVTVQAVQTQLPGEEAGHTIDIDAWGALSQTVAWADNEDEEMVRPEYGREADQYYPRIFFTINGVRTELTE